MGIGTFGAFTQARLAIYAAQTGISTTGQNISNINTEGYTRQRLNQTSLYVSGADRYASQSTAKIGQGVLVKSLSQIRSPYLDIRFRQENAQVGFLNAKQEGLAAIKQALDEVGKGDVDKGEGGFGVLAQNLNELYDALTQLTDQTGHQEYDNNVRQVAENLVNKLHSYANKLEEIKKNTTDDFNQDLKEVNDTLDSIRLLNEQIRKSEIYKNPALELRDERNLLLDKLSSMIDINVTYTTEEIASGIVVEKMQLWLDNANPDGKVETDEALLIDGVYSANLFLGTPELNPDYAKKSLPYLDDNKVPTDDPKFINTKNPDYEANYNKIYLDEKKQPTDDIRKANILKDDDNPDLRLMVSELKNSKDQLNVVYDTKATESITATADIIAKFKDKQTQVAEMGPGPEDGDQTLTVYTRYLKPEAADKEHPVATDYTYTAQVTYLRISKPVALDDNDLTGELQAERELLTEKGEFISRSVIGGVDENAGTKRGIQYYQRTLDLLANKFANVFNEANQGFFTDPDGNFISKTAEPGTDPTTGQPIDVTLKIKFTQGGKTYDLKKWDKMSEDAQKALLQQMNVPPADVITTENPKGKVTGQEVVEAFLKKQTYNTDKSKFDPPADDWEDKCAALYTGKVLFSNSGKSNETDNITAANINISLTWQKEHVLVRSFQCPYFKNEPASGQNDNINHFKYLLDGEKYEYRPSDLVGCKGVDADVTSDVMFTGTIYEMWNNLGTTLGTDQKKTESELNTHYESALSIDTERDSLSSVDFNDEAMNLMMYSKSYNAACRLMTTIDSVLDKLINGTGMTT